MPQFDAPSQDATGGRESVATVFAAFLKLGLTSFGGPIAHLGYFRDEFVARRKWLDDRVYADLVALCQFTPGPTSVAPLVVTPNATRESPSRAVVANRILHFGAKR